MIRPSFRDSQLPCPLYPPVFFSPVCVVSPTHPRAGQGVKQRLVIVVQIGGNLVIRRKQHDISTEAGADVGFGSRRRVTAHPLLRTPRLEISFAPPRFGQALTSKCPLVGVSPVGVHAGRKGSNRAATLFQAPPHNQWVARSSCVFSPASSERIIPTASLSSSSPRYEALSPATPRFYRDDAFFQRTKMLHRRIHRIWYPCYGCHLLIVGGNHVLLIRNHQHIQHLLLY